MSSDMTVGFQIMCAALANVLTSSMMAIFNAWIFRHGYHFQFSLIVVQQMVCSCFAVLQVAYLPGEKAKVKISSKNYFTMLLPFSVLVAAKLYIQNKAFEHVSPAFYAMIASTLPVGVTMLSIVRGIEPFRMTTLLAAVLVSVGGCMIKAGEVALSPFGLTLTVTALLLDVVRLVLVQYLVQPLKLSGPGLMLLSSPLQCLICAVGGALLESTEVSRSIEAGRFTLIVWCVLLLNGGLAMVVNLVTFIFVKVASAVVVAITTPFKDLSTVIMSDNLVVKRQETPLSVSGFSLACTTSFIYNIHNIYRKERDRAEKDKEKTPLILERQEKVPGFVVGDKGKRDDEERTVYWLINDAHNAMITCCAMGILLISTSILGQLDFAKVSSAYAVLAA